MEAVAKLTRQGREFGEFVDRNVYGPVHHGAQGSSRPTDPGAGFTAWSSPRCSGRDRVPLAEVVARVGQRVMRVARRRRQ